MPPNIPPTGQPYVPSGVGGAPGAFDRAKTPPSPTALPGLVGYWPFDEGKGTEAADRVSGSTGTLNGGRWVAGVRGSAIELNGASDYFYPGGAPGLTVPAKAPFTFALWVWTKEPKGELLSFRSHPDGLAFVRVWLEGGMARAWVRHDGGIFYPPTLKGPTVLVRGEWHHLALSRDPAGYTYLFVDGVSVDRLPPGREATGAITTNARLLGMESMDRRNADTGPFGGAIDEFCAFDRALTAAEVAKLAGRAP